MTERQPLGLEQELAQAVASLQDALARAGEAAAALAVLAPRIALVSEVLDRAEEAVREGRRRITAPEAAVTPVRSPAVEPTTPVAAAAESAYTRPTLVVAPTPQPAVAPVLSAPEPARLADDEPYVQWEDVPAAAPVTPAGEPERHEEQKPSIQGAINEQREELISFRLEFESRPGPLDLRAVDEAISEHRAVRDVALLDYDGHRATLKVWIVASARPVDVQESIRRDVHRIFSDGDDVRIVALEDAA
ncbi:MAG TPA: hypothetical protein VFC53_04790 [Dehalococcoidia bacterium]|nr:hypothetical protein [Dehalococcoidia bacterium]